MKRTLLERVRSVVELALVFTASWITTRNDEVLLLKDQLQLAEEQVTEAWEEWKQTRMEMQERVSRLAADIGILRWEAALPDGGPLINSGDVEKGLATWAQFDDQLAETFIEEDLV